MSANTTKFQIPMPYKYQNTAPTNLIRKLCHHLARLISQHIPFRLCHPIHVYDFISVCNKSPLYKQMTAFFKCTHRIIIPSASVNPFSRNISYATNPENIQIRGKSALSFPYLIHSYNDKIFFILCNNIINRQASI